MAPRPSSPSSDEQTSKRRRIDAHLLTQLNPETIHSSLPSEILDAHRRSLSDRASRSNAADTIYFCSSRALVYHFLDMYDEQLDSLGKLMSCRLVCGICQRAPGWRWERGGKSKGSTTNMINHMRDKHALIWNRAIAAEKRLAGGDQSGEKGLSGDTVAVAQKREMPFNIDEMYRRLTRWIVTAHNSFTAVENDEFIEFVTYLKPALEGHLVQSQAIRDRILSHAGTMRQQMGQYMRDLPGLMAIACDAWTSANRIAFLAITGSWITSDWRLEETLLDFVELQGAHDGQNMATAAATALAELGIQDKLVALVSNNASSNGTLVRHLSTAMDRSSSASRWDRDKGHIRCLSHVIHLAVMSLLRGVFAIPPSTDIRDFDPADQTLSVNEAEHIVASHNDEARESDDSTGVDPAVNLASAIDKIRKIAKIVRSSPQRMELFRAEAERIEQYYEREAIDQNKVYRRKKIKNLILDVVTRWNSVFYMLERALEFSEAIDALTSHPKVKIYRPYALSKADWAVVGQICSWLKSFRSASTMMSAEKYPTLSFSLRVYFILISYVRKLETSPAVQSSPSLLAGVRACEEKLLEFFDKSTYDSEYYFFATILDPRFKGSLFRSNQLLTSELFLYDWLEGCTRSLYDICGEYYDTDGPAILQRSDGTHVRALAQLNVDDDDDDFIRAWKQQLPQPNQVAPATLSVVNEIRQYLEEEVTALPPLEWWCLNAHRFPRMAAMARDFLCIPGTSVAVERVFSTGRDAISVRRASLSADTIRTLMNYRAGIMLEKKRGHSFEFEA